jgi:hypothetical protein
VTYATELRDVPGISQHGDMFETIDDGCFMSQHVAYLLREYLPENIAQHLLKNEPSLKKM